MQPTPLASSPTRPWTVPKSAPLSPWSTGRRICPTGKQWASKIPTVPCGWVNGPRKQRRTSEADRHPDGKSCTRERPRKGTNGSHRDQELRFDVHDSPDYYKLKCSIFNDDKKTDLIGEAWIDLRDVIVPGGGQNDLWHQLNFKGKYAGDVRVELTYYDTRPKPEASPERRRQRDNTYSSASDGPGTPSGPRQLGPREIKRRPLPPGPGGYSSPVSAPQTPERFAAEESPDGWNLNGQGNTSMRPSPHSLRQRMPETPDDVGHDLQYLPDPYDHPPQRPLPHEQLLPFDIYHEEYDSAGYGPDEPSQYGMDRHAPTPLPNAQPLQAYPTTGSPQPEPEQYSTPPSPYNLPANSPYHSSPPPRTTPQATPPRLPQSQSRQNRLSTSPTKHAVYRDSPLRQSISHIEISGPGDSYPDPRFDNEDAPPPPPAHRGQITRISGVAGASRQSPFADQAPRTPVKFGSVEERSPLQRLEREYDPYQSPSPHTPDFQQQPLATHGQSPTPRDSYSPYELPPSGRRRSYKDDTTQLGPSSPANDVALFDDPRTRSMTSQRYSGNTQQDFRSSTGYAPPRRAQTFDDCEIFADRQVHMSEPKVTRPHATSPRPGSSIARKSITPTPSTPEDRQQMGSVPFSPDSYDVLNPGTSPSGEDASYVAAQETARQREVDKLRDQGPIIGNDGRVIDPSDHLPADTWAPEPERKNRKPEHVIRIRIREEARMQHGVGSSPVSARPQSMPNSPYPSSPHASISSPNLTSPPPPAAIPPSPQAESGGGRNRLKKPMPTRPLPTQPFPYAQTSPAVMTVSAGEPRPGSSSQRYARRSSPADGTLPRLPLSDYQGPSTNPHSQGRGPHRGDYSTTPTKAPLYRPDPSMGYDGGFGADSPLAVEMSTIDIGPSRTGRTVLQPVRGYGAY